MSMVCLWSYHDGGPVIPGYCVGCACSKVEPRYPICVDCGRAKVYHMDRCQRCYYNRKDDLHALELDRTGVR